MYKEFNLARNMNRYSNSSIASLFLICPLLVISDVVVRSMRGVKSCQICLAIFLGLLSILAWPPRADVYRHAMTFYEIQNQSIESVYFYYFRGDIVLLLLQFIVGKLGMNFEIVRFLFIFIAYLFYFNLYNIIINKYKYQSITKLTIFTIILLSVPFIGITYALRYALAISILCYYILKRYIINKVGYKDYFLLVLSPLIHFGSIWLVIIIILSRFAPNRINKILYGVSLISIFIISSQADVILKFLPIELFGDRLINFYISTEDPRAQVNRNIVGLLPFIINSVTLFLYIITAILFIPYNKKTKLYFILILFCAFTSGLPTLSGRINQALLIMGGIFSYFYINWKTVLCWYMVLTSMIPMIITWRGYLISNVEYIVAPVPIALCQSYNYEWLRHNVTEDGTLKIYNR